MHKLEFCLHALGNLIEKKDKDLSEKLLKLSSEAHYYYLEDQNEIWHNSNDLYVELFEEFEKLQKQKLNN